MLDEAEAVSIGVFYVHFAAPPGLVDRRQVDWDAFGNVFRMQRVNIFDQQVDDASGNAVAAEGGQVDPHSAVSDAHVTGVGFDALGTVLEFQPEAEAMAIKFDGRGRVGHMQEWNRQLDQRTPLSGCDSRHDLQGTTIAEIGAFVTQSPADI